MATDRIWVVWASGGDRSLIRDLSLLEAINSPLPPQNHCQCQGFVLTLLPHLLSPPFSGQVSGHPSSFSDSPISGVYCRPNPNTERSMSYCQRFPNTFSPWTPFCPSWTPGNIDVCHQRVWKV